MNSNHTFPEKFINELAGKHAKDNPVPHSSAVCKFTGGILEVMFPSISETRFSSDVEVVRAFSELGDMLLHLLRPIQSQLPADAALLANEYMNSVPAIYEALKQDIEAIVAGDPAAHDEFEVIRAYPGFYAIAMYRLAHGLHNLLIPYLPRIITEAAHSKTGIDIHPGAQIAPYFFIDHGTGIVIGETAEIGKNVKIYQGVTLGALSVAKDMAQTKRHPTIEENVVIYAGATILGGETVIGHNSIVGGNVWLTKSIAPHSRVYHKAAVDLKQKSLKED